MSSPAVRFAAARRRQAESRTLLAAFRAGLDLELDEFQIRACTALEEGRGVLVAAPTGAGKTVVGEFAVHLALVAVHGSDRVGLLTGDTTVNGEAPVVVMTTEVLRNMLYAGSPTLAGLGFVVMDEVHYLADRFRGAVWEEVIIHLAEDVQLVSLSATVSNAEEFGAWLDTVRGDTEVVVEEHRPVPLFQHVLVGNRMHDLFVDAGPGDAAGEGVAVNPKLLELARDDARYERHQRSTSRSGRGRSRGQHGAPRRHGGVGFGVPGRVQVIERLDAEGLLP